MDGVHAPLWAGLDFFSFFFFFFFSQGMHMEYYSVDYSVPLWSSIA
jgi:hypothetical protein